MSQESSAKAKLMDNIPRKNIVPGPNSWALAATQCDPKKLPQPIPLTNRDKYENKAMPPTPGKVHHNQRLVVPKHRQSILPAAPLLSTGQIPELKQRAATDPVVPQPLFASKLGGIVQLSMKVPIPKIYGDLVKKDAPAHPLSENESKDSESTPTRDNSRYAPPSSAPLSTNMPSGKSTPSTTQSGEPIKSVKSMPLPTRRYLRENNLQAHELGQPHLTTPTKALEHKDGDSQKVEGLEAGMDGLGISTSARTGTFDRTGDMEYVFGHERQRVESHSGVIEEVEPADRTSLAQYSKESRQQDSGSVLPPMVYSPSNYGGVWENDPHVGYSLPPFTPSRPKLAQEPENQTRDSSQGSGVTVPVVLRDYHLPPSRLSTYQNSLSPVSSWAPNSHVSLGNSFAAPDSPLTGSTHSQFSQQGVSNAAPTPPRSHPEFQPSGPLPAELAHLEMNLHYHLDSCFASLGRLVTEKHDWTLDQVIRRLENLEESVKKGQKYGKGETRDIRKELSSLKEEFKAVVEGSRGIENLIKALTEKVGNLEQKVGRGNPAAANGAGMNETGYPNTQHGHRRIGSAHTSGNFDQREQHLSGASHSNSTRHQSSNSSNGRDPNTLSGGRPGSAAGVSRRHYFAELGTVRGPAPDLRDHPAYSSSNRGYSQALDASSLPVGIGSSDAEAFQAPSFSESWYARAYGHQ